MELNGRCTVCGTTRRREDEERSAEEHEAEPESDRVEGDDLRDLDRAQSPGVVQAVAQRPPTSPERPMLLLNA